MTNDTIVFQRASSIVCEALLDAKSNTASQNSLQILKHNQMSAINAVCIIFCSLVFASFRFRMDQSFQIVAVVVVERSYLAVAAAWESRKIFCKAPANLHIELQKRVALLFCPRSSFSFCALIH